MSLQNHELAQVLSVPRRAEILDLLMRETTSPARVAKRWDVDVSRLAYHFRVLKDHGLIEEVETKRVRGSVEHIYHATRLASTRFIFNKELPQAARGHACASIMEAIIDEGVAAVEAGTIDAHDSSRLSCLPMVLDQEGWEEVSEAVDKALEVAELAQKRSAERIAKSGHEGIGATVVIASFASATSGGERSDADAS